MLYGPAPPDESSLAGVRCTHTLTGHSGAVLNVRFNASGQFALSCGKDRTLRLWSLSKGVQLKAYTGHGHEVRDVACATDNSKLVTVGGDKQVFYYDVATGNTIRKFKGHDSAVNAVQFACGGAVIVTAGYDRSVRWWDCRSNSFDPIQVCTPFSDSVTCLAPVTGHVITAGSVDGTLRAFDVRLGKCTTDTLGAPVTGVATSRDGACLLAALTGPSVLRLLDCARGILLAQYTGHVNPTAKCGAALTADDARVVAGGEDGRVCVWDVVDASLETSLEAHPGHTVCGLDCHPTIPSSMVTCATDGSVKVWGHY